MRRAGAALAVTVIAMWLVLSFKSSPVSRAASAPGATVPSTTVPTAPADGTPPAGPPPPGTGTPTTPGSGTRTVNGDVVSTRYGDVQVAVILNGSQIVDVKALQLPFDRPRSQDISTQAAPLLHDEVLQVHSAQIDTIGGATYTSDAYAQSLQSALDKAHA
jgi:FMN-binding domain